MRKRYALALIWVTLSATASLSQTDPPAELAVESKYSAAIQQIESATDLDDAKKAIAIDGYKQAAASLEATQAFRDRAKEFTAKNASIQQDLESAQAALAAPLPKPTINAGDMTLTALDSTVQQKLAEVAAARQELATKNSAIEARESRLLEIPKLISAANARLADVEKQLGNTSAAEEDPRVAAAKDASLKQRKKAIQSELDALNSENILLVANGDLLPLQRDDSKRRLDAAQAELEMWQQAARQKRESEVDRDIRLAKTFAETAPDSLKKLAQANVESALARRETESQLRLASKRQKDLQEILTKVNEQFQRAQSEASSKTAVTQLLGDALRSRRDELKRYETDLLSAKELQSRASEVRVRRFLYSEDKAELEDIPDATRLLAETASVPAELTDTLQKHLQFRKSLLEGLITDADALFQTLVRLEATQSELTSLNKRYSTFIDERVLWIRSTEPFGLGQVRQTAETLQAIADPAEWRDLPVRLWKAFRSAPFFPLLTAVVLVPLVVVGHRLREEIRKTGESAESGSCRDFSLTLRSSLFTVGTGVVWPAALYFIGIWLRGTDSQGSDVIAPLAAGCIAMSSALLPLEIWRHAARPKGLMVSHFASPPRVGTLFRKNLRWLVYTFVPLAGAGAAIATAANPAYHQSLGRVVFAVCMALLSYFIYRTAHPTLGAPQSYLGTRRTSILFKTRFLWFWLLVAIPLAITALSLAGYQFTAEQLAHRFFWTSLLLLGLWFAQSIVLRWVVLSRRRLAIEQMRARLAKVSEQSDTGPGSPEAMADIGAIDLSTVDLQTRRLVRAISVVAGALVIWSLWVDVLPALSRFGDHDMPAWGDAVTNVDGDGVAPQLRTSTSIPGIVSYADIFAAVFIFMTMLLAMRDLPGLLELVLLQRLPLDVALRFAITTLTRYVIFVVGVVWALARLEIGWSQVQWLVAGVSVGLGFGLQEIFANFVSGLIILFERPLRAGDIVTIDAVSGVVKSIRLRSTIIQDWDRKDLIVPNKDFITGRLLNWTLSDEVSRIVIPVGIAYGSDTKKAKELIISAAKEHEQVAADPEPTATFEEFGESSLNLTLRCFITLQNMPSRLRIIDELHTAIDNRFRAAQIEIPFPQRDLHLRSADDNLPPVRMEGRLDTSKNGH